MEIEGMRRGEKREPWAALTMFGTASQNVIVITCKNLYCWDIRVVNGKGTHFETERRHFKVPVIRKESWT